MGSLPASVGEHGFSVYLNPRRMYNNCLLGNFRALGLYFTYFWGPGRV